MTPTRTGSRRRGSTLLLVLWAIMFMSFAVIGLVKHLDRGLDDAILAEKDFRARLILESARTVAAHPAIPRGDPLLHQTLSGVSSWEIHKSTEGSRLAVNRLADSRIHRRIAELLFEKWGMDSQQARSLVEAMADWIDADSRPRTHGAERDTYVAIDRPDYPFNRPFESLDDMLLVRGAAEMERLQPGWRNYFTLHGDGTIDVHTAPGELLEAVFDVTPTEVRRFVDARNGPDTLPETEDDPVFRTMEEVRRLLDVPEVNFRRVRSVLTLAHPIRRTECIARAGDLERRLTILEGPGMQLIREE